MPEAKSQTGLNETERDLPCTEMPNGAGHDPPPFNDGMSNVGRGILGSSRFVTESNEIVVGVWVCGPVNTSVDVVVPLEVPVLPAVEVEVDVDVEVVGCDDVVPELTELVLTEVELPPPLLVVDVPFAVKVVTVLELDSSRSNVPSLAGLGITDIFVVVVVVVVVPSGAVTDDFETTGSD